VLKYLLWYQEAPASITRFERHVSNQLRIIYLESSRGHLSIDISTGPIGEGEGGGVSEFFAPPLQNSTWPLLRNTKFIVGILSSSPVDWHPFWENWVKGRVCGHVQRSEAHALECRPRGELSQWSSNSPQTYRKVPA